MTHVPEQYREKPTLKIQDIQSILDISRSKAYALAQEGMFPTKKLGHTVRIPTIPFFTWLNQVS